VAREASDDPPFTNPITGIAGCCARPQPAMPPRRREA
jgi:hypothetical protein